MEKKKPEDNRIPAAFKVGAIASAFLIIGYQAALFIRSAAVAHIVSHQDRPDTVYVVDGKLAEELLGRTAETKPTEGSGQYSGSAGSTAGARSTVTIRRNSEHSEKAVEIRRNSTPRRVESFDFDPNTIDLEGLMRLGFSEKQAQSILNYREKGGRYRRPEDFAKSFVVADSVYDRLKDHIKIPKTDINAADSAAFDALPGIGAWFAAKMVSHREELGGYSYPEQLLDIYNFGQERFDGLKDLISVGQAKPYPLWTLPEEELRKHPYIDRHAAHGIVIYRQNNPPEAMTMEKLIAAGILDGESASKLARCRIEPYNAGPR